MINYQCPLYVTLSAKDNKVRIQMDSNVFAADKSKKGAFWGGTLGGLMTRNAETHNTASSDIVTKELKNHFETICTNVTNIIANDNLW